MEYTADRVLELIQNIEFVSTEVIRVFWVQLTTLSRKAFADQLLHSTGSDAIIPLIIREKSFTNANSVLSDLNKIIDANQDKFPESRDASLRRITIVLLSKDSFELPQLSSPITLPHWFPVLGGKETNFRISDLFQNAEVKLLNCPECRVEHISSLLYDLESSIVRRLEQIYAISPQSVNSFAARLLGTDPSATDGYAALTGYRSHLSTIVDKRVYRPTASDGHPSLVARMIRLVLRSSPKDLASHSKALADHIGDSQAISLLKPTIFCVLLRPTEKLTTPQRNWHSIFLGIYQAYQVMNGAAHSGDYGMYPVGLLYSMSTDLRHFLNDATFYIDDIGG